MKHAGEGDTIRRHWWAAALLGFLAPGAGQFYTGRARLAGYVIGAFVALFALFQTPVPSTFIGFVVAFVGALLVSWGAAIEAGMHAWRHSNVERRSYQRWYFYVAYALAFAVVSQGINMGALAAIGQPSMFGAYRPYRASSESSVPTLMPGDYFLAATARGATKTELSSWLGSIAIVGWSGLEGSFVHRLIAVGGQTVGVANQKIRVDGKELPQRDICSFTDDLNGQTVRRSVETAGSRQYVMQNFPPEFARDADEVPLPDDYFFVIGDNRENSNDSRFQGPVENKNYAGRALFIFWSNDWSRIGKSLVPTASIETAEYCPMGAK